MTPTIEPETKELAPTNLLSIIAQAVSKPGFDVDVIGKMLDMQERVMARDAEMAFNAAMQSAQSEMVPIVKDMQGDKQKRYASLEAIDKAIRPIYTRHGFALSFGTAEAKAADHVHVTCDVRHIHGHCKTYHLEGALDVMGDKGTPNKSAIKGLGSSVRYLRRYLTTMIFNLMLAGELDPDDKGRAALITDEQRDQVYNMVNALELGEQGTRGLLALVGVSRIELIQKIQYEPVMSILRGKLAKKQGRDA